MRYFIQFSYFGKNYHGWQNQPNALTVQQALELALSKLLRTSVALVGAGRTDAGVHAREMFSHFDVEEIADLETLTYRLNAFLSEDIAVKKIFKVPGEAHARFDAIERTYEYWVTPEKNPFLIDFAYFFMHSLNVEKMNEAAQILLLHHDFECFSKSNTEVKTYLCTINSAIWHLTVDRLVFTISADRFLRNMVRAIVGTLLQVGQGKIDLQDVKTILKSRDRSKAGPSVPAKGLYLTKITYPKTVIGYDG
ncbi:MAG: tRNA pseudouridine(38-40) synthase TruA [Maribacter sp.]|nr:tRNA pseudouridine(38-40) synthase TruA [Maribacter sp.]